MIAILKRRWLLRVLLAVIVLVGAAAFLVSRGYDVLSVMLPPTVKAWMAPAPDYTRVAPLFTSEVAHWEKKIQQWAAEYEMEPNLLATVMQIESCGHPTVASYAGAQGLFQVMPFHFASTEDMLDPDTNAMRGVTYLKYCLDAAKGDIGLTLACYNGGPSVLTRDSIYWDQQVKSYYRWGTGIYADALTQKARSDTLDRWLAAGGDRLCNMAAAEIGLR